MKAIIPTNRIKSVSFVVDRRLSALNLEKPVSMVTSANECITSGSLELTDVCLFVWVYCLATYTNISRSVTLS